MVSQNAKLHRREKSPYHYVSTKVRRLAPCLRLPRTGSSKFNQPAYNSRLISQRLFVHEVNSCRPHHFTQPCLNVISNPSLLPDKKITLISPKPDRSLLLLSLLLKIIIIKQFTQINSYVTIVVVGAHQVLRAGRNRAIWAYNSPK